MNEAAIKFKIERYVIAMYSCAKIDHWPTQFAGLCDFKMS